MASRPETDQTFAGMPSMRAIKSFVASAKYKSFTAAASALCLTQSAVSKQVRELEAYMGTELFVREGRSISLTADGELLHDAVQLSFMNITQATERLRRRTPARQMLTVCCTPTFADMWLQPRLVAFLEDNPDIELTVLTTHNFTSMEAGVAPDVYIAKMAGMREGYDSTRLFDDVVYPVCTPQFLQRCAPLATPADLRDMPLLDLSPYGRSQVSEHVDWKVWLALHGVDIGLRSHQVRQPYSSNDYRTLVNMALAHQGISLGWHHLVKDLVESGTLVRVTPREIEFKNRSHYLAIRKDKVETKACKLFANWIKAQFAAKA